MYRFMTYLTAYDDLENVLKNKISLYECSDCGSPVSDVEAHDKWHQKLRAGVIGFGTL